MNRFEFDICIPVAHPAILGHFPGDPIVPGVLILDQMLMTTQQMSGLQVSRFEHVKPDERSQVVCDVDGEHAMFQITLQRQATNVILASGKMLMRRQSHEALD
jgi:3-hydroxyacyl-[acyl-carrier-protein] dehydratase